MKFYVVRISPLDYQAEGEDLDEHFTSLVEAKKRRRDLIKEHSADPKLLSAMRFGGDFKIESYIINTKLPLKKLLLAVLNRRGYAIDYTEVVPMWLPKWVPKQTDEVNEDDP